MESYYSYVENEEEHNPEIFESEEERNPEIFGDVEDLSEILFSYELCLLPEFRNQRGTRGIHKITREINRVFYNGDRSRKSSFIKDGLDSFENDLLSQDQVAEEEALENKIRDIYFPRNGGTSSDFSSAYEQLFWIPAEENENYHKFSEEHFALMMSLVPDYENHLDKPSLGKIAYKVNEAFHDGRPVRTKESVRDRLSSIERRLHCLLGEDTSEDLKKDAYKKILINNYVGEQTDSSQHFSLEDLKGIVVLSSLAYQIKSGIPHEKGVPINFIVEDLRQDTNERRLNLSFEYISGMFREKMDLNKKNIPHISQYESLKILFEYSFELSRDNRFIIFSRLDR